MMDIAILPDINEGESGFSASGEVSTMDFCIKSVEGLVNAILEETEENGIFKFHGRFYKP